MRSAKSIVFYAKIGSALLLCIAMACMFLLPVTAGAQKEGKTVRVGWYESPFNMTDSFGRRSGFAYDYQQKIAAFSGWNYEYVEGSWPELMQMLINGEIDLMSDVSYTEERAQQMLFSTLPMGAEEYYIFISPDNTEISKDDYSTFNGKKVGMNKGSVQVGFFRDWAAANGVQAEIIEMTEEVSEALDMLKRGDIDMYVVLDGYLDSSAALPVCKVGASDFYFAVNRSRSDLLAELNAAMNRIHEEDHNYNQQLYDKYLKAFGVNYYLSTEEKNWLSEHGTIRLGYQDNYLSFCAKDKNTGELTGALKNYLEDAASCFRNATFRVQPVAYPSAAAAIEALRNGEVDCMFPCNLSVSDGETAGLIMTPSIMNSEIYAIARKADQHTLLKKEQITAAVITGNPNFDAMMKDHFPEWKWESYADMEACLKAVADGKADCVPISNYNYNNLARQCEKSGLDAVATGQYLDYSIAVRKDSTMLYSILTRTTDNVSKTSTNAALTHYSAEEAKTTLWDFIRDNPVIDIAVVAVVLALLAVIAAQQRTIRAKKEVKESYQQVENLNKRVYVDALTSVRNKGGFNECINGLQARIDSGEKLEFAVIILDSNDLKSINDRYGHDKGDLYLQTASRLICRIYKHSPVFRIGGDEFAVVLLNDDYLAREALSEEFVRNASETYDSAENEWERVSMAMGIAEYEPKTDNSVDDVVQRADRNMYENKHTWKEARNCVTPLSGG